MKKIITISTQEELQEAIALSKQECRFVNIQSNFSIRDIVESIAKFFQSTNDGKKWRMNLETKNPEFHLVENNIQKYDVVCFSFCDASTNKTWGLRAICNPTSVLANEQSEVFAQFTGLLLNNVQVINAMNT